MCENCGNTDRFTEPFNDGEKRWKRLCSSCKVLTTMMPDERLGWERRQAVRDNKPFEIKS